MVRIHTPCSIDRDVRRLLGTYAAEERDVAASARAERVCRRLEPMMNDADIAKRTKALRLVARNRDHRHIRITRVYRFELGIARMMQRDERGGARRRFEQAVRQIQVHDVGAFAGDVIPCKCAMFPLARIVGRPDRLGETIAKAAGGPRITGGVHGDCMTFCDELARQNCYEKLDAAIRARRHRRSAGRNDGDFHCERSASSSRTRS